MRFYFLHTDKVGLLLRQPWQQIIAADRMNPVEVNADYAHLKFSISKACNYNGGTSKFPIYLPCLNFRQDFIRFNIGQEVLHFGKLKTKAGLTALLNKGIQLVARTATGLGLWSKC
jgi:hypothetical protein